ncbi:DNA gyrase subunit A [Phascolarctobacterium sp.]|uniref:DNA gyrase subunit A n=1 Tax=Phascolarctobacterium sp. TaxID=2049039 RepID=UPI003868CABF
MDEQNTPVGKVLPVYIEEEMQKSYIDYAMSVIIQRALPDVRDGLKPVHRRILYAMQEAGMTPTKPYKKSARIVGEVLGKYHPHGDSSVYDAIVRMAQDFSTRYLMVDGHGNFGSIDGDSPAAMRYTEVRMAKVAEAMLEDIEKDTVDFVPNYDESLKEPSVLPAKVPALLINGSAGIAVGMATNIPPHNLGEVVNGLVMLIDNPDVEIPQLMTAIKGPDFPTGACILGKEGITSAYTTGRGVVKIRAKAEIEPAAKGKHHIIITEIPYQVNKANLIKDIADLVKEGAIEGITHIDDYSNLKHGIRIVIELKADAVPDVVLNQLYKHTALQSSFGIIMLALVNGQPRILNLKQILEYYLAHQKEVVTRRTRFELGKAKDRAHILEGLKIALDNLDEVITTIRSSATADIARTSLMDKFKLSQRQAQAILDMRLQRLTGLERKKIDDEYIDVLETIDWLESVLADERKVLNIIKDDLLEMKKKFGDERRTEISRDTSEMEVEDLIAEEDIVVTISHQGYIKRQTLDNFRNQKRGGVGKTGGSGKKEDCAEHLFLSTTHHNILFFTTKGRVYRQKGYEIPEAGRTAKGTAIINLLPLEQGEKITAVIPVKEFLDEQFMFMATNKGTVKKTNLKDLGSARKAGLVAINLDENEDLIGVELTDGNSEIILATRNGIAIRFDEQDVRPMGRTAHGVKGISLNYGDEVVAMDSVPNEEYEVLTATEFGMGKRTAVTDYRKQTRGGKGIINIKITEKTGAVVGMRVINPAQEIMMITSAGIIIRIDVDSISQYGRNAQGVKLMTLNENDKVVSLAAIHHEEE